MNVTVVFEDACAVFFISNMSYFMKREVDELDESFDIQITKNFGMASPLHNADKAQNELLKPD